MTEGKVQIHGKTYLTVAYRVNELRKDHPGWGISTDIIEASPDTDVVIMKAIIFDDKDRVVGTGHAEEKRGSTQINKTSALENCETSAIGRALAACGYGGTEYASANEVQNAIQQQEPAHRFKPGVKEKVIDQSIKCIEQGDSEGLKEIWAEFDSDEKVKLWALFNPTQRNSIKELLK